MAKVRQTNVTINYKVNDAEIAKSNVLLNRASKSTDELRKNLDRTKTSSKGAGDAMKRAGDEGSKSFINLNNILKTVSIAILAERFLAFTKQVIATRGEFQKFEAVLTNTLGSKSAALIALGRINEFAKSTPFGVAELTANFIKLANRGVEPTVKQMRAIADLSATLGKSFDQVVEAILDINNPERWKEIGVKAETSGDKVRLSFRDARIEVDRTVQGVTDAVVALGQLNGVAGSTEAISKTLAGQTSNLSDAWDQLLNTIGKGNEGVLFNAISLLSKAIEKANELLKGSDQQFEEMAAKTLSTEIDLFNSMVAALGGVDKAETEFAKRRETQLKSISDKQKSLMEQRETASANELMNIERELFNLRLLYDIYNLELPKAINETIKKLEEKNKKDNAEAAVKNAKKQAEESKKIGQEVNDYLAYLSEQEMFNTRAVLEDKTKQRQHDAENEKENADRSAKLQEFYRKLRVQKEKEASEEAIKIAEDEAAKKRQLQEDLTYAGFTFARALANFAFTSRESELSQISDYYDEQIDLAGDNERVREELQIKKERALEKARLKEKEAEKKQAIGKIVAETAINIVEAFPNAVLMALAASLGAVQAATVRKLAKGEIDLKGGTPGKDSIPAMLMPHESVMTAKETAEAGGILRSIRAKKLNDRMLKDIVSGRSGGSSGVAFDDSRLLKKLDEVKNAQPDIILRANTAYEARHKGDNYKQIVRSKSFRK